MKKFQLPIFVVTAFIFGVLFGVLVSGLISNKSSTQAECDEKCQLQANIEKCIELKPKLDEYLKKQNNLVKTNFENNRLVFIDFAKYLDSLYYETYSEINLNQMSIRDALYQASDRSAELFQESSTTNDQTKILEIQNMLEQQIKNINFYSQELLKSCEKITPINN